jgi:hypothetical protein
MGGHVQAPVLASFRADQVREQVGGASQTLTCLPFSGTIDQVDKDDIVFMICPFCSHAIAAAWQPLGASTDELGRLLGAQRSELTTNVPPERKDKGKPVMAVPVRVILSWRQNTGCNEIVVQVTRTRGDGVETWFAVPKRRALPALSELVTDPLRKDYFEACTLLDDSPRMSSVLSRHILADLLRIYAKLENYGLANRIDAFIADTRHPSRLRENLHYLREIADFSAHTQTDQDDKIIEVTLEEAQWTLKIVADLFDYFIVDPQKDAGLRTEFDKKIEAAGRKRIAKPLPDPPPVSESSK